MTIEELFQKQVNAIGIQKGYPDGYEMDIKNTPKEILSIETKLPNYEGSNVVYPSASGTTLSTNGKSMTSDISIRGDANFKASNILEGVSIFRVNGTAQASSRINSIIDRINGEVI